MFGMKEHSISTSDSMTVAKATSIRSLCMALTFVAKMYRPYACLKVIKVRVKLYLGVIKHHAVEAYGGVEV